MTGLPKPFNLILREAQVHGWDRGHNTLNISRTGFLSIVQQLLGEVEVDADFYLSAYPDVKEGIEKGNVADAHDHFVQFGYMEGRVPNLDGFDAERYRASHADLRDRSPEMTVDELSEHFVHFGYGEGRTAS